MPVQNKDVIVTVTKMEVNDVRSIKIEVKPDPVDLQELNNNGTIQWKLDPQSVSVWSFDNADGIAIARTAGLFTRNGAAPDKKVFTWTRNAPDNSPNDYNHKYTIKVTDGTTTASWDPTIINQP